MSHTRHSRRLPKRRLSAASAPAAPAFRFSLDETGWKVNDVRDYRLSLELDCALADGTTIHGSASTTHCN